MEITSMNAQKLSQMFLAGAKNLDSKKEWINELNVFPVPDGDTGTNMSMTILSAAREVSALENPTMEQLAKAISSGSLRGARGNSGVILSQLFSGFCKVIKKYDELNVAICAEAAGKAVEKAYKAVMKPKEGTILTVAKGAAEKAEELADETDDLVFFLEEVIKEADYVLSQTPEMLPVLKQAGVVDSGGQGLVEVLKGAYDALIGKKIDYTIQDEAQASRTSEAKQVKFGYSVKFMLLPKQPMSGKAVERFKTYLESIGDSVAVDVKNEIVRTQVHTDEPGIVLQKALAHGALVNIKIYNLREEQQEKLIKEAEEREAALKSSEEKPAEEMPHKDMGFISVSVGSGINEIFRGLGVDYIIEGGQTMNPSTEDMLKAIERVNADHIFILPNNKNIVLAANQAASLVEDKDIIVIPTTSIPQGITALVNFISDFSPEENKSAMMEEIGKVKTGQVTYAVRDTEIDGKTIRQGDYMGIGDKSILSVGSNLKETAIEMVEQMIDEESAIVSIYYGAESNETYAQELASIIAEKHPDVEVEINDGGQPIYYYVISVE